MYIYLSTYLYVLHMQTAKNPVAGGTKKYWSTGFGTAIVLRFFFHGTFWYVSTGQLRLVGQLSLQSPRPQKLPRLSCGRALRVEREVFCSKATHQLECRITNWGANFIHFLGPRWSKDFDQSDGCIIDGGRTTPNSTIFDRETNHYWLQPCMANPRYII